MKKGGCLGCWVSRSPFLLHPPSLSPPSRSIDPQQCAARGRQRAQWRRGARGEREREKRREKAGGTSFFFQRLRRTGIAAGFFLPCVCAGSPCLPKAAAAAAGGGRAGGGRAPAGERRGRGKGREGAVRKRRERGTRPAAHKTNAARKGPPAPRTRACCARCTARVRVRPAVRSSRRAPAAAAGAPAAERAQKRSLTIAAQKCGLPCSTNIQLESSRSSPQLGPGRPSLCPFPVCVPRAVRCGRHAQGAGRSAAGRGGIPGGGAARALFGAESRAVGVCAGRPPAAALHHSEMRQHRAA